jgi:hypothetical protein
MSTPTKEALKHLFIVFAYSGVSAILPTLLVWLENAPRRVVLILIINAVWYAITRYLKERRVLTEQR